MGVTFSMIVAQIIPAGCISPHNLFKLEYTTIPNLPRGKKAEGEVQSTMASFKCRNIGKKCRFEVEAHTDSQVLDAVLEHVEKAHEKGPIPRETVEQIKKAIKK